VPYIDSESEARRIVNTVHNLNGWYIQNQKTVPMDNQDFTS